MMRKEADMLRLFPEYLKGEELFGLTVHAVLRIAESVGPREGGVSSLRRGTSPLEKGPVATLAGLGWLRCCRSTHSSSAPSLAAARRRELPELPVPLRAPSTDGTATDDQPHRLCPLRAQDPHPLQAVSRSGIHQERWNPWGSLSTDTLSPRSPAGPTP